VKQKYLLSILAITTLSLSVLFPSALYAASACTCYDSDGKAHPESGVDECIAACNGDAASEVIDGGGCFCPASGE